MQRTLTLLVVFLVSIPAQAQSRDDQDICSAIGKFARTVMQNRQAGATMVAMMSAKAKSPEFQELGETLIKAAFQEPLAGSEEQKQQAVNAFESSTTKACNSAGSE